MSSVLRPVRKRKKVRTLGPVDIIRREDYADLEVDAKVELIRSLVPLGLLHVEEVLDEEVTALAGERYARKDASMGGRRHGSNPGTVGLAGQRVPIRVPRLRRVAGSEIPLRSYAALHGEGAVNDLLLKRVLYGISCRNYEAAAEAIPGAIGLSGSTVSRGFIEASAAKLRELQERDLAGEDVVAMVLDGKTFADATMVIALGITISGEKRFPAARGAARAAPACASRATPASGRLGSGRGSAAARGPCDGPRPGTGSGPGRCEWPPAAAHPTVRASARGAPGHHPALGAANKPAARRAPSATAPTFHTPA